MTNFQQIADFRAECDCLAEILEPLADSDFEQPTLFKEWTLHDVVAHLHIFNYAADASIHDHAAFEEFKRFMAARRGRLTLREQTDEWFEGKRNRPVYDVWRAYYPAMCDRLDGVDPRMRVEWFGPPMSARSSITARQMETWAHGQEVFDVLGLDRRDTDRIRNIVFLGLNTFGWTYAVRGLDRPDTVPHLRLTAPSGAIWTWNEDEDANRISGEAVEFAQVVTQVRNIADTSLRVIGPIATEWMSMAQCFAGPPETPPAPGTRHKA
ncbi:MAG: TIGR03084 family metal-binding protein [Acidobacteria bacterium]|nr:TIGR03084 family metal-binding protein [Acidobacteriota bacterium]